MADELTTAQYESDDKLHEVIASFEQACDAGQNPSPNDWLTRYPELASRLADYFANQEFVRHLADPLGPNASGVASVTGSEPEIFPEIPGYQILEVIGRGGMGVVYKARQLSADRIVALKVIRPDRLEGLSPEERGKAIERFITEAQAAAKLVHDNIVDVYEVGEFRGRPFYSMRYVVGRSLHDLIQAGPFEGRRAAAYLEKVARAVHEAHRHGILHRDLKPHNVLVEVNGDRPFVADFGLAKLMQGGRGVTATGDIMGTPPYMSPEQAQGSANVTVASDVYSLGATLYALLTGRPPFQAATPLDTILQVLDKEPENPRLLNPQVERDIETICLKCLEKEPRKRYASAEELADRLLLFLEGKPIPDRPITRLEKFSRWCGRNPLLAATGGVASAALMAVVFVSVIFGIHAHFSAKEIQDKKDAADVARERAEDRLCRSMYDQAQTLLASNEIGRRWKVLELVKEAERLRSRDRAVEPRSEDNEPSVSGQWVKVPTKTELRSLAVSALLLHDIQMVREWHGIPVAISSNNRWVVLSKPLLGRVKYWLVNVEDDRGPPWSSWEVPMNVRVSDISPDGRWVAWLSENRVILRDTKLGKTETLPDPAARNQPGVDALIMAARLIPDGKLLVNIRSMAANTDEVLLWDLQSKSGPKTLSFHSELPKEELPKDSRITDGYPSGYFLSPRGRWLAYWSAHGITALNLMRHDKPLSLPVAPPISGIPRNAMAFSTDDQLLAVKFQSESLEKSRIILWDLNLEKEKWRVEFGSKFQELAFNSDNSRLATIDEKGIIRLFRVNDGREELDHHWLLSWPHRVNFDVLHWHKDGRRFFSPRGRESLVLWEPAWDCPVTSVATGIAKADSIAFSPDGKWMAVISSSSDVIHLIDRQTGIVRELYRLKNEKWEPFSHDNRQLAFSPDRRQLPDSRQLGVVSRSNGIILDVATGKEVSGLRPEDKFSPYSGTFTPDGHFLVHSLGSKKEASVIRDITAGRKVWEAPNGQHIVYLGGAGRFAVTAEEVGFFFGPALTGIRVWDLRENCDLGHLETDTDTVEIIVDGKMSPDGRWGFISAIQVIGGAGPRAHVWSLPSCQKFLDVQGGYDIGIKGGTFAPDGKLMAVGYEDDTLQLWNIENREELFQCKWHGNMRTWESEGSIIEFTPDGRFLAATDPKSENVELLDLIRLNAQLAELGLDW